MSKWTTEDDAFLSDNSTRMSVKKLAAELCRGEDAVRNRQIRLGVGTESPGVPIKLDGDDELVAACMAEGGFPRAVVLNGKTFWVGLDGYPWRRDMVKAAA